MLSSLTPGPRAMGALLVLTAVMAGVLAGCEPRTPSPISGRPVTAAELQTELAKAEADAALEELQAKADAEKRLRAVRREAEDRLRRVQHNAQGEVLELASNTEADVSDVIAQVESDSAQRASSAQALLAAVESAGQDLERQRQQRLAVWGAIKSIPGVSAAPGFAAADGLVTALLLGGGAATAYGVGTAGRGKLRQRADQAEGLRARAETQLSTTLQAAERVVDSIDVLRQASPEVAAAMEKHKQLLDQWQGLHGKALVDRLQRDGAGVHGGGGAA